MSPGMKNALMWAAIILLVSYLLGINVPAFVNSVIHAAQTVHQANAH